MSTAYDAFLQDHPGLSRVPTRDRRVKAREDLDNLEKIRERAIRTRKHAADARATAAIDAKLDSLDVQEQALLTEIDGDVYLNSEPLDLCPSCGKSTDDHNDYGTCPTPHPSEL